MVERQLKSLINARINDSKVIIILGPRQSGKTTLIKTIFSENDTSVLWWNGDETDIRQILKNPTSTILKSLIGKHRVVVIDEAQRIENIGLCMKLIHDNIKQVKVIASGSSSFELANKINEPLTGRKWEFFLYPLSYKEMVEDHGSVNEKRLLERRLIYGYYPEVVNNPGDEKVLLQQLSDSYLYKDILTWEKIHRPDRLESLVQALAFQVGNQVSYNELGRLTGIDKETVERYIILLERAFIVFRLGSLSRNLRKELKKSRKIYFYDNGLRNAVIKQYSPIELRNDIGALWENFLISERMKYLQYNQILTNQYFWRTHDQQEIDYIEERDGKMYAFEFKWNKNSKKKFPKIFSKSYPNNETKLITRDNYLEFIV